MVQVQGISDAPDELESAPQLVGCSDSLLHR